MEGEIGVITRIAMALIVQAVILSVIFIILGFTRGATNEGIIHVQNSMDGVEESRLEEYNQVVLSGAQVSSIIKVMDGKPVALVVTNIVQNSHIVVTDKAHKAAGWADSNILSANRPTGNARLAYKSPPDGQTSSDSTPIKVGSGTGILKNDGNEIDWKGTNYGAILKSKATPTTIPNGWLAYYDKDTGSGSSIQYAFDIYYRCLDRTLRADTSRTNVESNILAIPDAQIAGLYRTGTMNNYVGMLIIRADGSIPFNNQTLKTRQSGNDWFIRGTAKYHSKLIKDTTGTTIGLVFIQIA